MECPPKAAGIITKVRTAAPCADEHQGVVVRIIYALCAKFVHDMGGHDLHVLHHLLRLFEHRRIDPLKNVLSYLVPVAELAEVGVVYETGTEPFGLRECSADGKLGDDRMNHKRTIW